MNQYCISIVCGFSYFKLLNYCSVHISVLCVCGTSIAGKVLLNMCIICNNDYLLAVFTLSTKHGNILSIKF